MRTTIDAAGRLVVPKQLRDVVGLVAGEVEVVVDGDGVHVSPVATDVLVERDGLLLIDDAPPLTDEDVRRLRLDAQR